MFGAVNEELLIREPNSNQDFHEWFDSIVQINYPPEESDLMLFDEKQKADLELGWMKPEQMKDLFILQMKLF